MSKSLTRVFCVFTTAVLMGAVAHAQGGASGSEAVAAQVDKIFAPYDRPDSPGYTLAAQIVKRVSGQSLREFAEANIFKPLGMARTFFRDDHAVIVKNQAYAYVGAPNNTFKLSVPNYDTVGASSLLTTVEDLARWDQNFYDYRVGGEDALAQMQTAGKLNE